MLPNINDELATTQQLRTYVFSVLCQSRWLWRPYVTYVVCDIQNMFDTTETVNLLPHLT